MFYMLFIVKLFKQTKNGKNWEIYTKGRYGLANPTNHSEVLKPVLQWGVGVIFDQLKYWGSGQLGIILGKFKKIGKMREFFP